MKHRQPKKQANLRDTKTLFQFAAKCRHLCSVRTILPPVSCQFLRRIPDGADRQLETGAASRWWVMECTAEQRSGSFLAIRCEGGKSLAGNQTSLAWAPYNVGTVIPRLTKIIRSGITFVSRNRR